MSEPREREARALVLRRVDYGEADLVVTLLTDAFGKRTAFARSARKSRRRFGGGLQPLTLLRVRYADRAEGGLARLHDAEVEEGFTDLSSDLHRLCWASLAIEWTEDLAVEGEPSPVFDTALELLRWLLREGRGPWYVESGCLRYALILLAHAGYLPVLDACVRTGRPLAELVPPCFSALAGGVLEAGAVRPEDRAREVGRPALELLGVILAGRFPPPGPLDVLREARSLVLDLFRTLLDGEPKALALLQTLWL